MVNYLSKFSRRVAELCVPLNAITGKNACWVWGPDQEMAFENIKRELASYPILCSFDINRRHRVSADSSQFAIGAVLLQETNNGEWQPVEYASRKLTSAETRYAMVEKEALAITWACERFDYYLVSRSFEVETDHKPLIEILGEKDLSQLPIRVQRFKMRMMRYGFTIFHTPGARMYVADSLSRPSSAESVSDLCLAKCASVECFTAAYVNNIFNRDIREEELIRALHKDDIAQECLKYIFEGWPRSDKGFKGDGETIQLSPSSVGIWRSYNVRNKIVCSYEFKGVIPI